MQADKTAGMAGTRINYAVPGTGRLFTATARARPTTWRRPSRRRCWRWTPKWGEPALWRGDARRPRTPTRPISTWSPPTCKLTDDGWIARAEDNERIYLYLFVKTFLLSAHHHRALPAAGLPGRASAGDAADGEIHLLMILVLLPFWTSLLVRTTSLDRAVAGAGRGQRPAGRRWA